MLNRLCQDFDSYLALVVTLAVNLEHLDLKYPEGGGVTSVCMILHSYHRAEEVAGGDPYLFHKLKKVDLWAVTYPEEPGTMMTCWVPLPVKARSLVLQEYDVKYFQRHVYARRMMCRR